jgi:hypothetical protein
MLDEMLSDLRAAFGRSGILACASNASGSVFINEYVSAVQYRCDRCYNSALLSAKIDTSVASWKNDTEER